MIKKLSVSVLIPTYKRAHLLSHVFDALTNQTNKNFDVIVILKPSGDKTEEIIEKYKKILKIKMITQNNGFVTDAVNIGLKNSNGNVTALLDDDATPFPDWIQKMVETYSQQNVGGVAGNVISSFLNEKNEAQFNGNTSEIVPNDKPFLDNVGRKTWSCPLKGLEDYLVYVSKAGVVEYNLNVGNLADQATTKSLFGAGANMSVLTEAIKDFKLPKSWILGWGFEQYLAWHVWKQGYNLLYNPEVKVSHLVHGQTLSRNLKGGKKQLLHETEIHLYFYRLHGFEKSLSIKHRATWLIFRTMLNLKQAKNINDVFSSLEGTLIGNIIGLKMLVSKNFGYSYDPICELIKINKNA